MMIMKFIVLFLAILSSVFFFNYKYSKGIRIMAFNEEESPKEATWAFVNMVVVAVLWSIYFTLL